MARILVAADDLSGAADCGIGFAAAGLSTVVMLSAEAPAPAPAHADVLAVDADSRALSPDAAARRHLVLFRHYRSGCDLFYKKIDSTLRGNFAAELAAVLSLAGLALVAPAFPEAGRVVRQGRVYVAGVPLEDTEIWRRERMAGPADIPLMLTRAGIATALAPLALVRGEAARLRQAIETMAADGAGAVVCDAETNADLASLADATLGLERSRFWVGSAGLARALPAAAGLVSAAPVAEAERVEGSILAAVGSLSAVSRAQARRLAEEAGVVALTVSSEVLLEGASHPGWRDAETALARAVASGDDILLTIGMDETPDMARGGLLSAALGRLVAPFVPRLGALIATGGDTARAVLAAAGVSGLRLLREIEPGVVLGRAATGRPLPVVTKAGAFGAPDTLMRCHRALAAARRPHGLTGE